MAQYTLGSFAWAETNPKAVSHSHTHYNSKQTGHGSYAQRLGSGMIEFYLSGKQSEIREEMEE